MFTPALAFADEVQTRISAEQKLCNDRVDKLDKDIHSATTWRGIIAIVSAAVAAIGSGLAGFVSKPTLRRVTGVAGACGAVLSAVPTLVPSTDYLAQARTLSEKHKLLGDKVWGQLPTINDHAFTDECERYVIARYVSCASPEPDANLPALPEPQCHSLGNIVMERAVSPIVNDKITEQAPPKLELRKPD